MVHIELGQALISYQDDHTIVAHASQATVADYVPEAANASGSWQGDGCVTKCVDEFLPSNGLQARPALLRSWG